MKIKIVIVILTSFTILITGCSSGNITAEDVRNSYIEAENAARHEAEKMSGAAQDAADNAQEAYEGAKQDAELLGRDAGEAARLKADETGRDLSDVAEEAGEVANRTTRNYTTFLGGLFDAIHDEWFAFTDALRGNEQKNIAENDYSQSDTFSKYVPEPKTKTDAERAEDERVREESRKAQEKLLKDSDEITQKAKENTKETAKNISEGVEEVAENIKEGSQDIAEDVQIIISERIKPAVSGIKIPDADLADWDSQIKQSQEPLHDTGNPVNSPDTSEESTQSSSNKDKKTNASQTDTPEEQSTVTDVDTKIGEVILLTDIGEVPIPAYSGSSYAIVNNGQPFFTKDDLTAEPFEYYSSLDEYGRCGYVYANICSELMPDEERADIGQIRPTGFHQKKYESIKDDDNQQGYIYNRCHLRGHALGGTETTNNLITGTRQLNVYTGMESFEMEVAQYIKHGRKNTRHVLYRVTPIFENKNLLANGVLMEAMSVEDNGQSVCFCVFVYNVQQTRTGNDIIIDYKTGYNSETISGLLETMER